MSLICLLDLTDPVSYFSEIQDTPSMGHNQITRRFLRPSQTFLFCFGFAGYETVVYYSLDIQQHISVSTTVGQFL